MRRDCQRCRAFCFNPNYKEKWQDIWGVSSASVSYVFVSIGNLLHGTINIEDLAKELNISIDELKRHLQK